MVAGRLSASFREGAGGSKGKYCQNTNCFDRTAHEFSPHEFRERDTRFPQDGTQDDANLFQEPGMLDRQRLSPRPRKIKTLRVVLPRDDAEDLVWKPESRCKTVASYGPVLPSWTQAHRRGGQAVNPSQVGFHLIKREWSLIPFTPRRGKMQFAPAASLCDLPCLPYPIDVTGLTDEVGSWPGTVHSLGAPPAAA
jgi:hypothetical protein